MAGRRLSLREMGIIKRDDSILNSAIKRGEYTPKPEHVRTSHVVCGCGATGCVFITGYTKEDIKKIESRTSNTN